MSGSSATYSSPRSMRSFISPTPAAFPPSHSSEPAPRPRTASRLLRGPVRAHLHAGAGGDRLDELEPTCRPVAGEDALAAPEEDRLDHQVELVDEAVGDE